MKAKVKPSEQLSDTITSILNRTTSTDDQLGKVLQVGAQWILQEAVEVEGGVGCDWYQQDDEPVHRCYCNGYTPVTLNTTPRPLRMDWPRIRVISEVFESQLFVRIDRLEQGLIIFFHKFTFNRKVFLSSFSLAKDHRYISG